MYYEFMENIAQNNRLRDIHPGIKLVFGLGCILIAISSQSLIVPLLIIAITIFATLILAKIDLKFYLMLLTVPLGFAIISVLVIIFLRNSGDVLLNIPVFDWFNIIVSTGSLNEGLLIFARVFAGMCSLFFIALTTPVTELFTIAAKCRIPHEFIDLAMLIYRFIFVLIEQAVQIHSSQVMRLGYGSTKEAINSYGMMAGSLFINTWVAGEDLMKAMDCRCYDGKFALNDDDLKFSPKLMIYVIIILAVLIIIAIYTYGFTLFGV